MQVSLPAVALLAHTDAFNALPSALTEHILFAVFLEGGRRVATRAQLSRVCKCALTWKSSSFCADHQPVMLTAASWFRKLHAF